MTRPRARTTTAIRFPEDVHQRLKDAAEERDLSINFMVVKAVEEMLENLDRPDAGLRTAERQVRQVTIAGRSR
jgi:predicted transcriptional regulator